jgi:6-phosphogluconolactonase
MGEWCAAMSEQAIRWHAVRGITEMAEVACSRILELAARAVAAQGWFSIVLAGGGTPRATYRLLRAAPIDWGPWHVYFGDERCVAADDGRRNSLMAARDWLDHVPIPRAQIHPIPAESGAREAARVYIQALRGVGEFDLVLLGLGEDGHTASLVPGHDWGANENADAALAVLNAPKPPPERVSLSAHRLGRAAAVMFLVAGESKRDALARWRAGDMIPAAAITPKAGIDVLVESSLLPAMKA